MKPRFPIAGLLDGASVITLSFWVAICAAAPELIWRGLRIAIDHFSLLDLYSALLIGAILAFFVEPMMERMRALVYGPPAHAPRNVLFTAAVGLAFALVAVCLHDAMKTYLSNHAEIGAPFDSGVAAGIMLAIEWAAIPFTITLAWLSVRWRWLAVPTGITACVATYATGEVFAWSDQEILTTVAPSLVILALGYRCVSGALNSGARNRCARAVALVAVVWLVMAVAIDVVLNAFGLRRFDLYSTSQLWTDVRAYLGWALGLLLAPSPHREIADGHPGRGADAEPAVARSTPVPRY